MSMNGNVHHHRRGHSFNGIPNVNSDHHNLHLFPNSRRTHSFASFNDVSGKLGRLFAESERLATSGIDDLLSSTEGGKHDYDWLLTPPRTPDFPSPEGQPQPILAPSRSSLGRPTSNANASRILAPQSENKNQSRPARNSSMTRSSISTSQHSSSSSYSSSRTSSILNTSSASVPSYTRPSSPIARFPSSAARPSTLTSRTTPSSRVPTTSSADIKKSPRPSTPSSSSRPRPHLPANMVHSPPARSLSRPSTPTRRHSMPSPPPPTTPSSSTSAGRGALIGRNSAPVSRPSSPSRRPQPVVPPDFPLETPPNLRTTLPDRPVSAGRSRPGAATLKPGSERQVSANMPRRQPSPVVNRGRLSESIAKSLGHANANVNGYHGPRRVPHAPEAVARRSLKAPATATDSNGLGRTISKKSLDMAIRHMDIRNSSGTVRSLSSATLFPQSIRTSALKTQPRGLSAPASVDMNGGLRSSNNGACSDVGNDINQMNGREIDERQHYAKLSEVDIYESSRYDVLLLRKEDLKNTDWLHSADDKCDQGLIFDNGFESLPEPFGLV